MPTLVLLANHPQSLVSRIQTARIIVPKPVNGQLAPVGRAPDHFLVCESMAANAVRGVKVAVRGDNLVLRQAGQGLQGVDVLREAPQQQALVVEQPHEEVRGRGCELARVQPATRSQPACQGVSWRLHPQSDVEGSCGETQRRNACNSNNETPKLIILAICQHHQ